MIESHSKEIISNFRKMNELEASKWLLENYPPINEANMSSAIFFLSKRSWRKKAQVYMLQVYAPLISSNFIKYAIDSLKKSFDRNIIEKELTKSIDNDPKKRHFVEYYLYGKSSFKR